MAINPNYVLTEANQDIVTLVNGGTGSQGRKYVKVNSGWCFCAIYYDLDSIDWYGIVLVSNVSANAVAYKAADRYGTYYSATPATVNYNGETWYITYPNAYVQQDSGSVKNWSYADVKGYYPDWYVSQYNETELIEFLDEIFDKCTYKPSGGAGSGYIGNSLLSNKKMVGYNVPTSSAESTKTESVEDASTSPVSGKPKIGNGFAKIKLLREIPKHSFRDLARTLDIDHKQVTTQWADISPLSQYYNTDYILVTQQYNGNYFTSFDGIDGIGRDTVSYTGCRMFVPIKPIQAVSAKASVKIEPSSRTSQYSLIHLYLGHLENNEWTLNHIGGIQINGTESEWTEISKIFDSPINAEYIVVYSMDNQWHFKNVEITGDLL